MIYNPKSLFSLSVTLHYFAVFEFRSKVVNLVTSSEPFLYFSLKKPIENCKSTRKLTTLLLIQHEQLSQYLKIREDEEDDVCSTCFHEYTEDNPKIVLQCGHIFHLACIYEWMERSKACPFCSKKMLFLEVTTTTFLNGDQDYS
ncbi:hypothetical protein HID58_072822 [Brassica napus]|uniref:RING-type E3 ubiquitin transferase n=1 Tax=Brassica napus TaxID=3708 RepID=A0ABQ7Z5I5_BRANA|nr:hypothetical protein HID58_072822 [Brassica napus]